MTSLMCVALAIYFEARGEPLAGQIAVAQVIKNRIQDPRYPADACAVVKQGYYWGDHPCAIDVSLASIVMASPTPPPTSPLGGGRCTLHI
jgi:spore germination cell wall hydrolase CwlJ-like protein